MVLSLLLGQYRPIISILDSHSQGNIYYTVWTDWRSRRISDQKLLIMFYKLWWQFVSISLEVTETSKTETNFDSNSKSLYKVQHWLEIFVFVKFLFQSKSIFGLTEVKLSRKVRKLIKCLPVISFNDSNDIEVHLKVYLISASAYGGPRSRVCAH